MPHSQGREADLSMDLGNCEISPWISQVSEIVEKTLKAQIQKLWEKGENLLPSVFPADQFAL